MNTDFWKKNLLSTVHWIFWFFEKSKIVFILGLFETYAQNCHILPYTTEPALSNYCMPFAIVRLNAHSFSFQHGHILVVYTSLPWWEDVHIVHNLRHIEPALSNYLRPFAIVRLNALSFSFQRGHILVVYTTLPWWEHVRIVHNLRHIVKHGPHKLRSSFNLFSLISKNSFYFLVSCSMLNFMMKSIEGSLLWRKKVLTISWEWRICYLSILSCFFVYLCPGHNFPHHLAYEQICFFY